MKITLLSDHGLRIEDAAGPLTIDAPTADMTYSPFHMMASGLGMCTYAVLQSWASHADLAAASLAVEVGWSFAEAPHRVGEYEVLVIWPELPESRRNAAARAAELCAVHSTLTHSPVIRTSVAPSTAATTTAGESA
ncbi:MAG: OsmC family protein [Gemmatimonadota bacterium]|nr:OsmC family protein [Gemmatimonadota bacterium]